MLTPKKYIKKHIIRIFSRILHPRSPDEVNTLKERIKDWAAAHGCLDAFENGDYEFLFKVSYLYLSLVCISSQVIKHLVCFPLVQRRQKQGGRGAKKPDSERKAFLEISVGFPTRNPKQVSRGLR